MNSVFLAVCVYFNKEMKEYICFKIKKKIYIEKNPRNKKAT